MNKRVIVVAVASALLSPLTQAEVTLYGRAHLSVDQLDNGADSGMGVSSNSSRVGVKGGHDLTDGLKGIWQIESEVLLDEGGGTWASRNSFGGIRGAFGTLRVGQFDTPFKIVGRKADLFGDQVGDARNLTRRPNLANDLTGARPSFDERFKNGIAYTTPNWGGLTGEIHYAPGTDKNLATDTDRLSAALMYSSGPLFVGLAHEFHNNEADTAEASPNATRISAYYDISNLRLTALYQQADNDQTTDSGSSVMGLGARYKMGNSALKAQYYTLDADRDEWDADMFAIGVDYSFNKATLMYVNYASVSNDDNSRLTPYGAARTNAPAGTPGETASGISLGLVHNF